MHGMGEVVVIMVVDITMVAVGVGAVRQLLLAGVTILLRRIKYNAKLCNSATLADSVFNNKFVIRNIPESSGRAPLAPTKKCKAILTIYGLFLQLRMLFIINYDYNFFWIS